MTGSAGVRRLVGLALRRDKVTLPVWIASLTAVHAFSVQSMFTLYPDAADRIEFAGGAAVSGVALMFNGLVSGTDVGTITMSQTLLVMLVGSALMSTFSVVRHTRQDEEAGRTELVAASAVGRRAPLAAALVTVTIANVVLAVANAAVLVAFGLPVSGSVAAGAAIGGVGLAFGGVAAVAAQLATTSRAANGLAGAAVALSFALRGVGDMVSSVDHTGVRVISSWPAWTNPLGWGQQVRPYDDDNWLLVALLITCGAATTVVAFTLLRHRDLGAGMLATRPGPPEARASLLSPWGLAWRLQRNVFAWWAVAMVVMGLGLGAMAQEVGDLVGTSDGMLDMLEQFGGRGSLVQVYLSATVAMAGIGAAAYTVQAALRVCSEESSGTLETVLSTSVGRPRWLMAHVVVAASGTVALLALEGAATGLTHGLAVDDPLGQVRAYAWAGLLQAPAALVLGGLAIMAFGVAPRRCRAIAWAAYALCIVLGQMGELFRLPDIVLQLSPFTHLPAVPVEPAAALPVAILCAAALGLTGVGVDRFRRRDVQVG